MDENASSQVNPLDAYYAQIKAEHEANNAWSAEQAQKAMDYQTEMSNTAHQREVADLKAAGLNPVLSAGGSGATTGSGLAAQRSDENVAALYGLTKQAIDGMTTAVKSMSNSAKYYSGYAGSADATGSGGTLSDFFNVMKEAVDGILYRNFGVPKGTGSEIFNYALAGWNLMFDTFGLPSNVVRSTEINRVPFDAKGKKVSLKRSDVYKAVNSVIKNKIKNLSKPSSTDTTYGGARSKF